MPLSLIAHVPLQASIERVLRSPGSWLLGRHPDCEIRLDHDSISRRHAELTGDAADGWRIEDLQSKNGLRVDGRRVDQFVIAGESYVAIGDVFLALNPISEAAANQRRQLTEQRRHETLQRPIKLAEPENATAVLETILAQLLAISECRRGVLIDVRDDAPGPVIINLGMGDAPEARFAGSRGALNQAVQSRAPVFMSAAQDPAQLAKRASVLNAGITAVAVLPLLDAWGKLLALAYLDTDTPGRHFNELDAELLRAFAERAASELALSLLDHRLNQLAASLT
ncbi:hypothetical protein C7S18_15005 [Ahniella affigens]|uniref:FHA domain-containing protein n=1 Tax=Ahniella affigens TaxID=2021234 RepID=A0A2P1PU90_9GAMM|nr:FHA domain-containing protein [Ahniella affigens]AVP98416.1 hypothetical protein C7S18_15005 [Ahniella affigens]